MNSNGVIPPEPQQPGMRSIKESGSVGVLVLALVLAFLLMVADALVGQEGDRFSDTPSHEIPHCDMPPRAAKDPQNTAPCTCIGMVAEVQEHQVNQCFAKHWSSPLPMPQDVRLREQYRNPAIDACMVAEVEDHCTIVARPHTHKDACRTSCKPERCGCHDGVCRAHGSGEY